MKYGGHGYSHILLNVLPKMLARGISQQAVDDIMINNPRQWLQFSTRQNAVDCCADVT